MPMRLSVRKDSENADGNDCEIPLEKTVERTVKMPLENDSENVVKKDSEKDSEEGQQKCRWRGQ